jgi:hypothetical protein
MLIVYELRIFCILKKAIEEKSKLKVILVSNDSKISLNLKIKIILLQFFHVAKVDKQKWYLKDFLDDKGSSIHFGIQEKAQALSLEFSFNSLKRIGFNQTISTELFKNLQIDLAQSYHTSVITSLRQIELSEKIVGKHKATAHILTDYRLIEYFREKYRDKELFFYCKRNIQETLSLILYLVIYYLSLLSGVFLLKTSNEPTHLEIDSSSQGSGTVLAFVNEEIQPFDYLRNEVSWYFSSIFSEIRLYCLTKYNQAEPSLQIDSAAQNIIIFLKMRYVRLKRFLLLENIRLNIFNNKILLFQNAKTIFNLKGNLYTFNHVVKFLWELESYNVLIEKINCKLFIYQDAYFKESHVFNFLADLGRIQSIKIQYSNVPLQSLLMISNPSTLLSFSDQFHELFKSSHYDIGPKSFINLGYPFLSKTITTTSRSIDLKQSLSKNGVTFVIGYFDESVQSDSDIWAYKTLQNHLDEIHEICNLLLDNSDIGVIYKTQFIRNAPYLLYPDDRLIEKAIETGRIIFPQAGSRRNIILPSEIAFASDLCIGDLVGATASLECALAGTESILIDTMNIGSKYRQIYYESNKLVYTSLHEALKELKQLRNVDPVNSDFGNWEYVLNQLELVHNPDNEMLSKYIKKQFDD